MCLFVGDKENIVDNKEKALTRWWYSNVDWQTYTVTLVRFEENETNEWENQKNILILTIEYCFAFAPANQLNANNQ